MTRLDVKVAGPDCCRIAEEVVEAAYYILASHIHNDEICLVSEQLGRRVCTRFGGDLLSISCPFDVQAYTLA